MGSMYKSFRTDQNAEKSGIIIDYGDFRVTIARAGGANKKYQRVLENVTRPFRRAIQTEQMDNERAEDLLKIVYARSIVRNWELKQEDAESGEVTWVEGIEGSEGDVLPVNEENIILTFDNLPDLFADIKEQAAKQALFRSSLREEAAGN